MSGWTGFVWYGTTMCSYDYTRRAFVYYGITIDHQGLPALREAVATTKIALFSQDREASAPVELFGNSEQLALEARGPHGRGSHDDLSALWEA